MTPLDAPDVEAWARNQVATYAALVRSRMHFAQAVYGDGEWRAMLGDPRGQGANVNGEEYAPELGEKLRETLLEPAGQWCVLWPGGAGSSTREAADEWIGEHDPDVSWIPFRPLGWAGALGLLAPFFRVCRKRRVVLVGPSHMEDLDPEVLEPAVHIEVPDGTAWREAYRLQQSVSRVIREDDLVIFCAGMASNLMIHGLAVLSKGYATLLDLGSTLDPYCGVYSRRVYRDPEWRDGPMKENLP